MQYSRRRAQQLCLAACFLLLICVQNTFAGRKESFWSRRKNARKPSSATVNRDLSEGDGAHGEGTNVVPPGKLDIVLAHYSTSTLAKTAQWWDDFINIEMVTRLRPRVFVYCQNPDTSHKNLSVLIPLIRFGGEIRHLDNKGREGRVYLHHITQNYDKLPAHTLFSQDIPVDDKLWHRFQKMFEPKTGFLPLAYVAHMECENGWLPIGQMPQMFAMFTTRLCPPLGFTAAYNGQFLVSRSRILRHSWWTYGHLLEFVTAPENHWIHDMHDDQAFKTVDNPKFGHVLERAWSLIFDCWDYWRDGNCQECDDKKGMEDCGGDACQCWDRPGEYEETQDEQAVLVPSSLRGAAL